MFGGGLLLRVSEVWTGELVLDQLPSLRLRWDITVAFMGGSGEVPKVPNFLPLFSSGTLGKSVFAFRLFWMVAYFEGTRDCICQPSIWSRMAMFVAGLFMI